MSTLEERRQIRDLTALLPGSSAEASSNRRYAPWKELVGANAPPLVATLALVCVATVALAVDVRNTGNSATTTLIEASGIASVVGLLVGGAGLAFVIVERSRQ